MSDRNRTAFALQARGLAETFNVMMSGERIRGAVVYRVELSAPDGPSTAGGKQATQHVTLIPEGGGATIVAGSVNQVERWAELRSFEHLKRLHAQRFKGEAIPVNRVQYDELLDKARALFADKGCQVRMAALPEPAPGAGRARTASGTLVVAAILGLAAAASGAVVWYLTHRG